MRRAALTLLLACAGPDDNPIVNGPLNDCSTGCPEGSVCESGRSCVQRSPAPLDFTLVMTMTDTMYYAPGVTYMVDAKQLPAGQLPGCDECFMLPRIARYLSSYNVTEEVASALGLRTAKPSEPAPMRATYTRIVEDGDGQWVEASQLGLPVLPVFAQRQEQKGEAGLLGARATNAAARLTPGRYRVEYQVDTPFRTMLPPYLDLFAVADRATRTEDFPAPFTLNALDPEDLRTTAVHSEYLALDGFSTWLADRSSGRVVSRRAALSGSGKKVYLATYNVVDQLGTLPSYIEAVVAPPPGSIAIPTLHKPVIGGALTEIAYPELPRPSFVHGTVRAPDGQGVRATLHLISRGLRSLRDGVGESQLTYTTQVATDAEGTFLTVLPVGTYAVYIDPDPSTPVSRRVITQRTVGVDSEATPGAQTEWRFELAPLAEVRGQVLLEDGRPLVQGEVRLSPSVPRAELSGFELPRPFSVRTDGTGAFVARVDADSTYDIGIVPGSGSRFARAVRTDQVVPSGCPLELGQLTLRMPARRPLTLVDPFDNQVASTWVRMFARAEQSRHFVEIASEMTDANGKVELLYLRPERAPLPPACAP